MTYVTLHLIWFLFLLATAAVFSSAEVVYTSLTLDQIKRINRTRPGALDLWEKNPDHLLATLLLSNSWVSIAVGVLATSFAFALSDDMGWKKTALTFLISFVCGFFLLIFGEILPKLIALYFPVPLALLMTPALTAWSRVVSPMANLAVRITDILFLGYARRKGSSLFIRSGELKQILTRAAIPIGSKKILDNVIQFSQSNVQAVMIPRDQIVAISDDDPMDLMIERVIQSGLSRIPIYRKSLDNIVGLLYAKDLLVAWRSGSLVLLDDLLRPAHFVSNDTTLPDLLRQFRSGAQHLSIVVDRRDKKTVRGLVTLQDALEAIVGDIKEET